MKTPVDFEKEVGGSVDISQLEIIGGFSMLIGALITLLLLMPELSAQDVRGLVFISGSIIVTGFGLYTAGRRSRKRIEAQTVTKHAKEKQPAAE